MAEASRPDDTYQKPSVPSYRYSGPICPLPGFVTLVIPQNPFAKEYALPGAGVAIEDGNAP